MWLIFGPLQVRVCCEYLLYRQPMPGEVFRHHVRQIIGALL